MVYLATAKDRATFGRACILPACRFMHNGKILELKWVVN